MVRMYVLNRTGLLKWTPRRHASSLWIRANSVDRWNMSLVTTGVVLVYRLSPSCASVKSELCISVDNFKLCKLCKLRFLELFVSLLTCEYKTFDQYELMSIMRSIVQMPS